MKYRKENTFNNYRELLTERVNGQSDTERIATLESTVFQLLFVLEAHSSAMPVKSASELLRCEFIDGYLPKDAETRRF